MFAQKLSIVLCVAITAGSHMIFAPKRAFAIPDQVEEAKKAEEAAALSSRTSGPSSGFTAFPPNHRREKRKSDVILARRHIHQHSAL